MEYGLELAGRVFTWRKGWRRRRRGGGGGVIIFSLEGWARLGCGVFFGSAGGLAPPPPLGASAAPAEAARPPSPERSALPAAPPRPSCPILTSEVPVGPCSCGTQRSGSPCSHRAEFSHPCRAGSVPNKGRTMFLLLASLCSSPQLSLPVNSWGWKHQRLGMRFI